MKRMVTAVLALLCACAADRPSAAVELVVREPMPLLSGAAQQARLCGRGRSDAVLDVFCAEPAPAIASFVELRAALQLESDENSIYRGFALTAHSTSLSLRSVSAINPRIIFVNPESDGSELISLAFARGEQVVEVVVRDRGSEELQFYLVRFTQDCNARAQGCSFGDLLSEAVESDWRALDAYGEEDLENTPLDCRVCHQPDGPTTPKLLRMQELQAPWSHWFWRLVPGGRAVIDDYALAKGDEAFAGVPGELIVTSQPGLLSTTLVFSGSGAQPNEFDSARIQRELAAGESATWHAIYERANRAEAIAVPYHDVKVTDPEKLARMTQAYTDYREGRLDRQALPDLRDVFPDDPVLRAEIGLDTAPELDGQDLLLQACGQCHNDRLDPSLSRARFNTDLSKLERTEKEAAIARIGLPADHAAAMPPVRARQLTEVGKRRLIALLSR